MSIAMKEYQARRCMLAKQLPAGSIALVPAAKNRRRNGDTEYRFRQDSDFYYLTGCHEPDAMLLIVAGSIGESVLFTRPRNAAEEQWTGKRLGQEGAIEQLGMQHAFPLTELTTELPQWFSNRSTIYYPIGRYVEWDKCLLEIWQQMKEAVRRGIHAPSSWCDLAPLIGEMRLFKSPAEIDVMRHVADISVAAHQRAMRACSHAQFEYELEAELVYEMTRRGCRGVAYDSIVASGANACTLHYTNNDRALRKGDLVLIDAGGEYENYAADITRTFPVNGRFSPEQALIYELVLSAQTAAIKLVRPGCVWDDLQQEIVRVLTSGLVDLGILKGQVDELIANAAYRPFYMHRSGHWLGLDVHDVGQYKIDNQWRQLEPGMVLTVEPGLYIQATIPGVDPRWHGIGVRIEDDIHVTADGHENLTGALSSSIRDVEDWMRG